MPKIQIVKDKKTSQVKYTIILPKEQMEELAAQQGDQLIFNGLFGNELRFRFKRAE